MTSATIPQKLMTTEELLALPDDGKERWLLNGVLWERDMTKRNRFHSRFHSRTMAVIAFLLEQWSRTQPEPRGEVLCGKAGFRLRRNPDTSVGIDVAYASSELRLIQTDQTTLYEGPPLLAVEILSPSNPHGDIAAKVKDYMAHGGKLAWGVDTEFRLVSVHRPGVPAEALDSSDMLTGDPELPGFSCPVADLFR